MQNGTEACFVFNVFLPDSAFIAQHCAFPMTRRLLNLITALSLPLFVAAGVMWLRGAWTLDAYLARHRSNLWLVSTYSGALTVRFVRGAPDPGPPRWMSSPRSVNPAFGPAITRIVNKDPPPAEWRFLGIRGSHGTIRLGLLQDMTTLWVATGTAGPLPQGSTGLLPTWEVSFPWWLPTAAFALPPLALGATRLRRRRGPRVCRQCGYDLRATPGRCPECGTAASVTSGG